MSLTVRQAVRSGVLRTLSAITLVNTFGNGMFLAVSALFFTRVVGLSVGQVGLGMTVAGAFGVVAGPPLGRLADRLGARRLLVVLLGIESALVLAYLQVHSFAGFLPVACGVAFVDRGGVAVRNALIATVLPSGERVTGRAFLRVITNIGMGGGAAVAALALSADTRTAYEAVVIVNAITFLVASLLLLLISEPERPERAVEEHSRSRSPFTDLPYLAVTALCGFLTLQAGIMEVGLPLWTVDHTDAPHVVVAIGFILNTVMVVLLQVRLSRGSEEPRRAARVCALSGGLLAVACLVFSGAHGIAPTPALVLIIAAVAVLATAEMLFAAGSWALSYELANQDRPGAYQGLFNSGYAAGVLLAPAVVAVTALEHGTAGWVILSGIFTLAGLGMIPATRWAIARNGIYADK